MVRRHDYPYCRILLIIYHGASLPYGVLCNAKRAPEITAKCRLAGPVDPGWEESSSGKEVYNDNDNERVHLLPTFIQNAIDEGDDDGVLAEVDQSFEAVAHTLL